MSQAQLARPFVAVDPVSSNSDGILGAMDYLRQSLATKQLFAVLTGSPGSGKAELLRRFLASQDCANLVHVEEPLYDPHEFMEVSLQQLGFEPFESSEHELLKLMQVFLRHEHSQGRRSLFVLEQAEAWGPRVFATIQKLAEAHVQEASMTFLLVGLPALNRVLDSEAMLTIASMTQDRHALDSPALREQDDQPQADPTTEPFLLVTTDGRMTQRCSLENSQLLIGRHAQNDVKLNSRYVSRHHALLVNRSGERYIVDLNSTNGTFVNSIQIDEQVLRHGDVITIGSCRLKYVCPPLRRKSRSATVRDEVLDTVSARPLLRQDAIRESVGVGAERLP